MTNGFNIYTRYLSSGVQKGLEGTGYEYIGRQSGFDSGRELANFEELIELGVDGIVIMPHKLESGARGAELAAKAGIPVVSLLRFGPGPMDEHIVGSVRQDARVADIAEWVTKNTEPCEVLLVPSVLGQGFSETYTKTLEDAFDKFGDGKWKIVGAAEGHYDRFKARAAVEGLLNDHPNAKVVIDYAAEMAIGIAQHLKANNIKDIVTITSDCTEEMIPWVKDGWITASRYYSPAWHGLTGVQVLRNYLENGGVKQLEAVEVPVADVIVTKENIDEWATKQPICYEEYFANVVRIP
jgi:ABC-type sugar transport system substrate-binding protein